MSGFEIAGIVLAITGILDLINRTAAAVKDAKDVPKGVLELLEVIRTDVERFGELYREQPNLFSNPAIRASVQGLHEQVDLEAVILKYEAKYSGKRSFLKKVKEMRSGGDVHLTGIHQQIQRVYSKWIVELGYQTNAQVGALEAQFRVSQNNLDVTLSSVQRGIRRLLKDRHKKDRHKKGKSSRSTKFRAERRYSKNVGLSGGEAARKDGNVSV